jgi:DNA-binding MarR family transcriptional regulator
MTTRETSRLARLRRKLAHDPDPDAPLVGALLRFAWTRVHDAILGGLASAGFGDLTAAHLKVLRYPACDGIRPTEVARRAGMTKQAANYLLGQLEALGYLSRADGVISLTERGWRVTALQRKIVRATEAAWAKEVGAADFAVFQRVLRALHRATP